MVLHIMASVAGDSVLYNVTIDAQVGYELVSGASIKKIRECQKRLLDELESLIVKWDQKPPLEEIVECTKLGGAELLGLVLDGPSQKTFENLLTGSSAAAVFGGIASEIFWELLYFPERGVPKSASELVFITRPPFHSSVAHPTCDDTNGSLLCKKRVCITHPEMLGSLEPDVAKIFTTVQTPDEFQKAVSNSDIVVILCDHDSDGLRLFPDKAYSLKHVPVYRFRTGSLVFLFCCRGAIQGMAQAIADNAMCSVLSFPVLLPIVEAARLAKLAHDRLQVEGKQSIAEFVTDWRIENGPVSRLGVMRGPLNVLLDTRSTDED